MIAIPRSLTLLLGWAVLVAGCQSAPGPVEQQTWTRLVSQHFEMWSSAPGATSQRLIQDLERFHQVLIALDSAVEAPPARIRVVAFRDSLGFDEFRKSRDHPSISLQTLSGPMILVDASSSEATASLRHGYLHAARGPARDPTHAAWYEEGQVEYLAQLELKADRVGIGGPPKGLAPSLHFGDPIPLRRLLGAGASRAGWSGGEHVRFRAQAWALVHLLRSHNQGTLDDRYLALAEFVSSRRHASGARVDDEAHAAIDGHQALFAEYFRQETFTKVEVAVQLPAMAAIEPAPEASATASALLLEVAREVAASDALIARLRARASGADAARTPAELREALDDPTVPGDQLAASIERWEGTQPTEAEEWTELAAAWEMLDSRDPGLADGRAAAAYHRALDLDPNDIEATIGLAGNLGTSWEDHTAAAMLLRRAASSRPGVVRIDLALADHLQRAGQPGRAAAVLEQLANLPHIGAIVDRDVLTTALEQTDLARVDQQLWNSQLLVRSPLPGAELEQLAPWVEVAGTAGLGDTPEQDIVVVFGIAEPTLAPSGLDINGNGVTGRRLVQQRQGLSTSRRGSESFPTTTRVITTDQGDSIGEAEKAVAAELVRQLDPATTRVAVLAYDTRAYSVAALGTPEAAMAAIDSFGRRYLVPTTGGIHTGLLGALAMLRSEPAAGPRRRASVFLVSGSLPNQPNHRRARRRAIETGHALGELGVQVHAFSVGKQQRRLDQLLLEVSQAAGGSHAPVRYAIEAQLPDLSPQLAGLESVEVTNQTSGAVARAQRVFSDGSFDAIVPLVKGENEIEVVARLPGRAPLRETRIVRYSLPDEPASKHRRRAAVLLWELRNRSIEVATRLQIAEAQAKRASGAEGSSVRAVTIEVEPAEPTPPDDSEQAEAAPDAEADTNVAAPPIDPDQR
jgi:hypothetical protein